MSGYNEGIRTFEAENDLTRGVRVKFGSSANEVDVAGDGEEGIGFADRTVSSGDEVAVRLDRPTSIAIAAGTFAYGADLYCQALGKVDDVVSGRRQAVALEAATAADQEVEVMPVGVPS